MAARRSGRRRSAFALRLCRCWVVPRGPTCLTSLLLVATPIVFTRSTLLNLSWRTRVRAVCCRDALYGDFSARRVFAADTVSGVTSYSSCGLNALFPDLRHTTLLPATYAATGLNYQPGDLTFAFRVRAWLTCYWDHCGVTPPEPASFPTTPP